MRLDTPTKIKRLTSQTLVYWSHIIQVFFTASIAKEVDLNENLQIFQDSTVKIESVEETNWRELGKLKKALNNILIASYKLKLLI